MSLADGDDKNMFYLNPTYDPSTLKIVTSYAGSIEERLKKRHLTVIFDTLAEFFIKKIKLDPIPVKKLDESKFIAKTNNNSMIFSEKYTQMELSFIQLEK